MRHVALPRNDPREPVGDIGVVIEAENGVGLWELSGEVSPVAFAQSSDGHHCTRPCRPILQVGCGEDRVYRILLCHIDESAGIHEYGRRTRGVISNRPASGREPAGELLGVDLIAGTAQGDDRDCLRLVHPPSLRT